MNSALSPEEQALVAQIEQVHGRLNSLKQALRTADAELQALSAQREQHQLLGQACSALDKLEELGVAELFWGERLAGGEAAAHVREVGRRVDAFQQRVGKIEDKRRSVVEQITHEQQNLELLEDDLFEAQEQEARRKLEWIVEREISALPARREVMPWTRGGEDDKRFRKALTASLLTGLLLGLLLPLVELPLPEPTEFIEVPERFARLIRQEERPLPPPQTVPEEPEPEQLPEPEPILAEEQPPKEALEPVEAPAPAVAQQQAPQRQQQPKGILAFRETFSNLADSRPSAQLGSQARISNAGDTAIGRPERSMVTTQGPGTSGGINLASLSRDLGGGGEGGPIAGVQVTRVASSIGADGGPDRPLSSGASAGRTDEEIQIVFDRYKAALYRLYNRELRKDPTLRGQIVLRITIEPDGSVSLCQLQSSDMGAPVLAQQVVDRVSTFDFGAKQDTPAITILYPIDFLPAA